MNVNENGKPTFKIYKKLDGKKIKEIDTVYVGEDDEDFDEIKLKHNEFTQLIPSNRERDVLYITAASGGGKSYFTLQFLKEYQKKNPKNDVFLFSSLTEDETLDQFKKLKRVKLNEDFLNEDFIIEDFRDTCIVFDDTDCIQNKKLREKIMNLQNIILDTGRHTKTTCIITSHLPTAGFATKKILNECHSLTFFPNSLGGRSLKYLLEAHIGLDKAQIKKIKSIKSRAFTFIKSYPNIILYEKGSYVLTTE